MRPVVLVTRTLPPVVEGRLRRDYQPRLNLDAFFAGREPRDRVA
jgi:hypothetical protein